MVSVNSRLHPQASRPTNAERPAAPVVPEPLRSAATDALSLSTRSAPASRSLPVTLTDAQAKMLQELSGIPFKAGRQQLTPEMIKGASVADLDRRAEANGPLPRIPLRWEDFTAPQKLRSGLPMSGADRVFDATEIQGVFQNLLARSRSQLAHEFFAKYPVPEAGILTYSLNMLGMNGAYGQSAMFHTLANAIMPVDNEGKPKNAHWKAFADAYDRHKAIGTPSKEVLENLWFKAHMVDFEIVDTPDFQAKLSAFWKQAETDSALEPMAIYTKAMVGGRLEFEKAMQDSLSEDACFSKGLTHFAKTVIASGTFPFWQHDLKEAARWFQDRKGPNLDARGLPTDKAMFERAVDGIKMMTGLTGVVGRALSQTIYDRDRQFPVTTMVDLRQLLTPEEQAKVSPDVFDFYQDPSRFDIHTGVEFDGGLSKFLLGEAAPLVSGLGDVPDRVKGFEHYPVETEIYQDAEGGTHWDRYVVVDGKRQSMFLAKFEVDGDQVVETFNVKGKEIPLYFDVEPYQGGIRLVLDKEKSSLLTTGSNIVFTTVPQEDGLVTTGKFDSTGGLIKGEAQFQIKRPEA